MNVVQKVRESRNKGVVIFTKFCLDRKDHSDHLFCFFEGEDHKYYGERIEKYTSFSFNQVVSYHCGGKKQVIKVYNLIKSDSVYDNVKKAFFIDRDFNPYSIDGKNEIYQTPCYSIENLYTSVTAFQRIISREFSLNGIEEDYKKCVLDYKRTQDLFHENITFFNAWIFCQREEERKHREELVILSDFKISRLFDKIGIDGVECTRELYLERICEEFPKSYTIDSKHLDKVYETFQNVNQQQVFRGKFELEFLKRVIEDLKRKNKDRVYFLEHRLCVSIDINSNPLSTLSQYADLPNCLIEYLTQYKYTS